MGRFARNIFSVQEQFDKVRKLCTTNYKLPLKNLELENLLSWEDESSESLVQARKYSKNTSSGMDITKVMEFAEMYIKDLFQKVVFREAVFTRYVSMSESGFQNVFKNQTEASIQVKQAQKDLHELNQELCSLKEDAASFKGIMYRAFEVFEQYRIDLYDKATDLKKQNSNLKIELECCQSDLSKLKEALQYTKSTSDETIRTLQEENKVEVDKGASTAIQIKEYGEEVKHIKAEMENNKKASETVCADLKQRLLDETRKNVDISKELNKYLSKLRDLEEESVCLTKMAHSTKEENELLVSKIRKELSSAVESNNDLTKKLGEANNEKEALSKRVSEAEATKLLAEQRLHEKELGNQKTIEELRSVQEQLAATTSQKVRNDDCGDHALVGCVRETTKDVEENAPPNCLRARVGEETTRDENVSTEKVQVSRPTSLKDRGEHLKNMTERLKKKSAMKSPRKNLKPKRLRSSISKTAPPSRKRAAAGNGAKDTTHNPIYSHGTLRRNAEEDDDWVVDATLG